MSFPAVRPCGGRLERRPAGTGCVARRSDREGSDGQAGFDPEGDDRAVRVVLLATMQLMTEMT
jgi:hypothetical protein